MKRLAETIRIAHAAKVNVAFWGRHGIGKTAVIESLNEEGFYVKTIILSQSDPLVLGGFPGREVVDNAHVTTFARPQWIGDLFASANKNKKIIVFLDEFNRADKYAHNAAMRLVNEGEICGHKVPEGTLFVMAMNPETETDSDINPISDLLLDRMCHVPVYTDPKTWLAWAKKSDLHPMVRGFVAANDERLNGFSMEGLFEKQVQNRILPTERSNHAVARILTVISDESGNVDRHTLNQGPAFAMIRGLCGSEYAQELVAFIENNYFQPFTVAEMLNPTKDILEKLDMLRENGQTQVIVVSLDLARADIPAKKLKAEKLSGFWKFLTKCPVDLQNSFWYQQKVNANYWSTLLAAEKLPEDVLAALNK